jgi:hypothetical protein
MGTEAIGELAIVPGCEGDEVVKYPLAVESRSAEAKS